MSLNEKADGSVLDHSAASTESQSTTAREWLTVEQAADYLQLSQSSIRSYIRQDRLAARRIAGKRKVLIHRSELLKLLEPARAEPVKDVEGE